jgi:pyruvate, water dikinase
MSEKLALWDAVPGGDWLDEKELERHPTWLLDLTHSIPRLMPMEGWFWNKFMNYGATLAMEELSMPAVKGMLRRVKNGCDYLCFIPITDKEEMMQRASVHKEQVLKYAGSFPKWWDESKRKLLHMYKAHLDLDLVAATNTQLLGHLYDLMATSRKMWEIHFLGLRTVSEAWVMLEGLFMELWNLNDKSPEFQKLMSGFDNKIMQTDKRLWGLAQSAKTEGISDVIMATDPKTLLTVLEQEQKAEKWLKNFKRFLEEDGWRLPHGHTFSEPPWIEEPSQAIRRLMGFLEKGGSEFAPDVERERMAGEREKTQESLLAKVPEERKDEFLKLLSASQLAGAFNEEHNYYCENYCHSVIRHGLLGIGKRLREKDVIEGSEDIFFLNPPEVERVLSGPDGCDLRFIVDRRRREWEAWSKEIPVPIITNRTSPEEAFQMDISQWKDPIVKVIFGEMPEVKEALKADLYGLPVSSGVVEGVARVAITAEDLDEIKEGDILVAPFTASSWTPVFALIKGVVTDAGGALSHTAIVSREHGIPAVANVGEGTKRIQTGQRIRIDGNEGVVYILDK